MIKAAALFLFTKKSCSVASDCLFVALFVRTFLTTAGDGMDEWSIEQVQDFVTAEFGSEIAQNFKGELRFTLAYG